MICTPELINGRWVLPLSEELLKSIADPNVAEFDVKPARTADSESVDIEQDRDFVDALDDVVSRRASTLKRLAQ